MNRNNVTCCDEGSRFIEELDNDQKADPGWRHIRMTVKTRSEVIVADTRIRHCPWCGFAFRDDLAGALGRYAS